MFVEVHKVTVTTAANGTATANTPNLTGAIVSIRYVKDDFADGSTFTITSENTGENIWTESAVNASATRKPRGAVHEANGAVDLYSAGNPVLDFVYLANDRVKIVIASGGNVTTGVFHVTVI